MSARRLAAVVGLSLFALTILIASVRPTDTDLVIQDEIQNSGHVVVFAIVSAVAFTVGRWWGLSTFANYAQAALVGIVGGVAIEVIQYPLPQRDASLLDVGRDVIGICTGLLAVTGLVSLRTAKAKSWLWRVPVLCVAGALFLFGIYPVIDCYLSQQRRDQTYPVILSTEAMWWGRFISRSECDWWLAEAPRNWSSDADEVVVHIEFHASDGYPGFGIRELFSDWSQADALRLDIYSPDQEITEIGIRVNDVTHNDDYRDRFSRSIELQPGLQTVSIPIADIETAPRSRRMDMTKVSDLYLYATRPKKAIRIMVDNIRLD